MAEYEKPFCRDGVMVPIQCIRARLTATEKPVHLHYHEYTELLFGLSGAAITVIGNRRYTLPVGGMIIVHTNEPHDVFCPAGVCEYIVIKFLPQVLLSGEQTLPEHGYVMALMANAAEKQILFSKNELHNTPLPALFTHMMTEWEQQHLGYELSLRADVTQIFLHILRCWHEQNLPLIRRIRETGQMELVRRAVSFVQVHYADLTEADVAAACGVSTTYFSRVFKKAMRVSFSAYLCETRLRQAERLLLLTEDSVTAIAQAVGFSTTSHFISRFRAARALTPLAFRRQNRPAAT